MGEGGIKNGQKNSDVFYGRPQAGVVVLKCDLNIALSRKKLRANKVMSFDLSVT